MTFIGVLGVAIVALAVEIAIARACFGWQASGGLLARIGRFLGLHVLVLALLLSGGYVEMRWSTYRVSSTWLDAWLREGSAWPGQQFTLRGDPGLLRALRGQRVEPVRPRGSDPEQWRAWQQDLRARLLELFALRDVARPRTVKYSAEPPVELDSGVQRRFLTIEAADGTTLPAYLFEPTRATRPGPGILVLHGHVGPFEEGISQTAGLASSYHHGAALELARGGFRTLTIELRGFGQLGAQAGLEHALVAHNALLAGSFYKAVLAQDVKQAVELLRALPEVDPERIGITGVSFGAELALTYAALDERIDAVALHGFGGTIGPVAGVRGSDTPQPHECHLVPGHNALLHQEDWYRLVAPRALVVLRGASEGVPLDALEARVRPTYSLLGAPRSFAAGIEPGGHEFFATPALAFFRRHL
jgi:dienelactone hydrolase